jgi:hypothetical protein
VSNSNNVLVLDSVAVTDENGESPGILFTNRYEAPAEPEPDPITVRLTGIKHLVSDSDDVTLANTEFEFRLTGSGENTLTFTCDDVPTSSVVVNVMILTKGG